MANFIDRENRPVEKEAILPDAMMTDTPSDTASEAELKRCPVVRSSVATSESAAPPPEVELARS